jgi:hypothetical protein
MPQGNNMLDTRLGDFNSLGFKNLGLAPGGFFFESSSDGIIAGTVQTQAGATLLTSEMNRVATVATANNGVMLPPSAPGLTVIVENAGANAMQVYGSGTDQINGTAFATGVSQMSGSVVIYTCYTAGNWYANGLGTGYSGSLETVSYTTGLTAHAGGGQGSATPLTTMQNVVSTVATAGDSVVLPAGAPGLQIAVINNGANSLNCFCPSGGTMNGTSNGSAACAAASVTLFFCISGGNTWLSK